MKPRLFVFALIVIVLVSLNWFKTLVAQDLGDLSAEDRRRLLTQRQQKADQSSESDYYQSPQVLRNVFEKDTTLRGDSTQALSDEAAGTTDPPDGMPEFAQLRPFGMELFRVPTEPVAPPDIASASDYVLGPGDNVIIYLWGRVEREYNLTFDREGKVFIPRVGELVGWGLTLERFSKQIKKHFSKVYSDFEIAVSLGKIRSIRIYVTGEVKRPGAYTVSSLTSLLNAIYIAGGPNERGSLRSIRLMRNGTPAETVDLYDLLLKGDNSTDVRLRTGDVVFVPVAGAMVALRGEVKRSAWYELKGNERALDLLTLAGNTTPEAHLDRVMLERISDDGEWQVLDLNLHTAKSDSVDNVVLKDGYRLTVYSIFDVNTNLVAVWGHVRHPGYYERNDSTRVSDVIRQARLQAYDVYYDRADLYRRYPDRRARVIPLNLAAIVSGSAAHDMPLWDRDSIYVYAIGEVERDKHVYLEGEVKRPGRYPLYDNMTVEDLIFLAGSYERGAYRHRAEIARLDSVGGVTLIYVNQDDSSYSQTRLSEDDHVYVRRIPEWQLDRTVVINGEINYPGEYTLASRDETLYGLLQRAGGFTANAFPTGIILERASIETRLQRQKVPELLAKSQPLVEDSAGNIVQQKVFQYDFDQTSRVIIDIERTLATEGREGDIVLEPGDRIYVPSVPSGISVMGAVGANGTIRFVKGKNVKYYIERAGNFMRAADKKGVRLVRAGGEVISGRGTLDQEVALGDVVVVPARIEKDRNWLKTITTAVSATTGILTSIYIVSKL